MNNLAIRIFFCVTCFVFIHARPEGNYRVKKIRLFDSAEEAETLRKFRKLEQSVNTKSVCGYDSCTKPDPHKLNVHIVPHTHDDVGWLKTVDQYYYGSRSLIQKAGVQYILDSVIQELLNDKEKKFIYVESAFFFKWWDKQTPQLQDQVRELVNQGRLEFIGGAWSMNDEADTHYNSIIDQFTLGLRRLKDTFGECGRPRVGWQIDPFGHSREQASLFAQMGYDGQFFGRLDYEDKVHRMSTKTAEMIWHGSANLGEAADLFTGVLFNTYSPPPGFCFDILCADEPIIDDMWSPDYNVPQRVDQFFAYVEQQVKHYRTNNIIITMGGDFTYMDANVYYKNLDRLIRYANERQANGSDINLFYSTPSCYLKALHDSEVTWPEKSDDFFPYASDPHSFWTGYFSSRPTVKRYERIGNHFLQICKQLTSFAPQYDDEHFGPHLDALREAMGIMQHHDAVTGTEKQKVAYDYARILHQAMSACGENVKVALNQLSTRTTQRQPKYGKRAELPFSFSSCNYLNISRCEISETSDKFIVTLYNPLAHSLHEYVRVPVTIGEYLVQDYRDVEILHQMTSVPSDVQKLDFRDSNATQELVFLAPELPPMGYKSFFITRLNTDSVKQKSEDLVQGPVTIGNKYLNLTFNDNGLLDSITDLNGKTTKLTQYFVYYEGATGNNREFLNRSSGAYIFRPNNTEKIVAKTAKIEVIRGIHVEEVRQTFSDWVSQVIRVYREDNFVEFEWMVGPIPVTEDKIGKEVVSRFYSLIENNGTFWTDSNGREMLKRERNHRDTWDVRLEEKIAGNYYPVTAKIAIEDSDNRMAVLTDRAQGGSSLFDGSIELMVHRRLLHDDAFGVDEALNEPGFGKGLVARGIHYLVFGKQEDVSPTLKARERFLQNQKLLSSWKFYSKTDAEYSTWTSSYSNIYSAITLSLPLNIHLLTFEPWIRDNINGHSYLIRFEHLLEKDEDPEYSKPTKFNMEDVFRNLDIQNIRETTLAGNQWLSDSNRLKFVADQPSINQNHDHVVSKNISNFNEVDSNGEKQPKLYGIDYEIILSPMEIRTFVITLMPQF